MFSFRLEVTPVWQDNLNGATLDIDYNPMAFDMTNDAGFLLAMNEIRKLKSGGVCIIAICCESYSAMLLGF